MANLKFIKLSIHISIIFFCKKLKSEILSSYFLLHYSFFFFLIFILKKIFFFFVKIWKCHMECCYYWMKFTQIKSFLSVFIYLFFNFYKNIKKKIKKSIREGWEWMRTRRRRKRKKKTEKFNLKMIRERGGKKIVKKTLVKILLLLRLKSC